MEASSRESWKLEVSISNHSVMAQGIGAELKFGLFGSLKFTSQGLYNIFAYCGRDLQANSYGDQPLEKSMPSVFLFRGIERGLLWNYSILAHGASMSRTP